MWNPEIVDTKAPLYVSLADAIEKGIQNSELVMGEKLPTHRALADKLEVTVGTVTRGYAEAERRGLLEARVGSGTFVKGSNSKRSKFSILHSRPTDLIDFSLNLPIASDASPLLSGILKELSKDVSSELDLLSYQPEQGLPRHRQWAAQWLSKSGLTLNEEQITITCGGQHAIMLALMAASRSGDTIFSEGLTYPGFNAIATQLGVKVIGLPMDEEGIIPEAFEEQCKLNAARALYCTPNNQNPTNATMGLERRKAIITIARRYKLWIIEDEVSSNLVTEKLPPLAALEPDICFYINSHSKTVAAGLRVGYLAAPSRLADKVAAGIQAQCWFTPPLPVEVAQRWLQRPDSAEWIAWQSEELSRRLALVESHLGDFDCKITQGSFHAWLVLPEQWRASDYQRVAQDKGVSILSAESFAVGRFPSPQAVRVSISAPETIEEVEEGLKILRELLVQDPCTRLSAF